MPGTCTTSGHIVTADLGGVRLHVVSRCARTLYNFRLSLLQEAARAKAVVRAVGDGGDGFDRRLLDRGVNFQHVPVSLRGVDPWADLSLLLALWRRFRHDRPQIVHSFTIKPAIFATLAATLAGVPIRIVTITGLGHAFTTAGPLVRNIVWLLYRIALARAHVVFFQNPDDRELFLRLRLVKPERARLIAGSGIDLDAFSPRELPILSSRGPRFLMIGRLLREKGVSEYMAAAGQIKERYPDASFALVGGADPRNPSALPESEIEQIRTSQAVHWLGEVLDVRPFIGEADVVVLPSYREGLPRSLLEGAAMGRALIATDVPGCRELIVEGETGFLARAADVPSLAAAMARFCENPASIPVMGRAAREFVSARYDLAQVNAATLAAYATQLQQLAAKSR